jgi:hypothetical protein
MMQQQERRGWPGHRRAEATPSFRLLRPAMTKESIADRRGSKNNMTQTGNAELPRETPKDASAPVVAQHAATLKALPFSDTRDFDDATRGFLGTIANARIASLQGRVVWSLEPYGPFRSRRRRRWTPACGGSRGSTPFPFGGARRLSGAGSNANARRGRHRVIVVDTLTSSSAGAMAIPHRKARWPPSSCPYPY